MTAFGNIEWLRLRGDGGLNRLLGSWRKRCDGRKHYPPMPEQDTDVLEVLISQMRESRDTDPVFGKALRILGHAELFEPVCNLLHRGTPSKDYPDRRTSLSCS